MPGPRLDCGVNPLIIDRSVVRIINAATAPACRSGVSRDRHTHIRRKQVLRSPLATRLQRADAGTTQTTSRAIHPLGQITGVRPPGRLCRDWRFWTRIKCAVARSRFATRLLGLSRLRADWRAALIRLGGQIKIGGQPISARGRQKIYAEKKLPHELWQDLDRSPPR
jgi:hypothetical protein